MQLKFELDSPSCRNKPPNAQASLLTLPSNFKFLDLGAAPEPPAAARGVDGCEALLGFRCST